MVISMAQRGQISEPVRLPCPRASIRLRALRSARLRSRGAQVTDAQLLGMLEKVNEQMPKTGITVRWQRRSQQACAFAHSLAADQPPPPVALRG